MLVRQCSPLPEGDCCAVIQTVSTVPYARNPKKFTGQALRFLAVGAGATLIQYFVLWLGVTFDLAPAAVSSAVGYLLGSVLNYLLNYFFTFESNQPHLQTASKFYVLVGIGWCINTALMGLLVHHLSWNIWLAQIVTTGICLIWNFAGSKWWAFRHKPISP